VMLRWVIRRSRRRVIQTVQVTMLQIHFPMQPSHQVYQNCPAVLYSQHVATLLPATIDRRPEEDLRVSRIIPASLSILQLWYGSSFLYEVINFYACADLGIR